MGPESTPTLLYERNRPVEVRPLVDTSSTLLGLATHLLRYARVLPRLWHRGELDSAGHARALRTFFEAMGGIWTKLGQLLAMRRDILSAGFCEEMSLTQDRASGFPHAVARRAIEDALGRSIDDVFTEFGDTPVAAASIAQVHVGRLRANGMRVAIKVRRPDIEARMRRDMDWLGRVMGLLDRLSIMREARWRDLHREVSWALRDELDFRLEAVALRRMRKTLRRHGVYAPKVFEELSARNVLVMEYLDGVLMSELIQALVDEPDRARAWLQENDIDPAAVGRTLFFSMQRQSIEDNLFHSDLHPGNIMLFRDSRVALIDFGAVGSVDVRFQRIWRMYIEAFSTRQHARAADAFSLLSQDLPADFPQDEWVRTYQRFQLAREALAQAPNLSFSERSLGAWLGELIGEMEPYHAPADWTVLRANRAQLTVDISLMYLIPRIDWLKLMRRYQRRAALRLRRRGTKERTGASLMASAVSGLAAADAGFAGGFDDVLAELRSPFFGPDQHKAAVALAWTFRLLGHVLTACAVVAGLGWLLRVDPAAGGTLWPALPLPPTAALLLAAALLWARVAVSRVAALFSERDWSAPGGR